VIDQLVQPGATYRYRLVWSLPCQPASNIINITLPPDPSPPVAPARVTATGVSRGQINLRWNPMGKGDTGYSIQRSDDGGNDGCKRNKYFHRDGF
jgi:hypothetical protein